jgi:transcriptional antiterminator NusG
MNDEKKETLSAEGEDGKDRAPEVDAAEVATTETDAAEAAADNAEAADGDQVAIDDTDATPAARKSAGARAPAKGKKSAPAAKKKGTTAARKKEAAGKAVAEVVEERPESSLPMKWYVIHTYSGHENKVKENILKMVKTSTVKDQFGRLIVPTEEVAEMKKGKKTITTRKFFPSYILIEMFMSEDSWHLVNGIPGVTSFVGTGTKPQPLSEGEVERILGRMDRDRETIAPEIPFTLGEHIRIKDGPFSDFTGVVDEINADKGKLRILVSIFGRETPVELDFLQVEPI